MPNALIALGILILLGVGVYAVRRRGGTWERRRARSERAAAARHAPMKADEEEHAAAIHEIVQEARTGDLPKYRDERRPTVREIARKYRRPAKHAAKRVPRTKPVTTELDRPIRGALAPAVMVPGPAPAWELESFSASWSKDEMADILARGKAGASR